MIIYIYNGAFFKKIFLPIKVNGVYPIFSNDSKFLINIEEQNNKWHIKSNEETEIYIGNEFQSDTELQYFQTYTIRSLIYNKSYFILSTPIYDSNLIRKLAKKPTINISSSPNDDIVFNNPSISTEKITLTLNNNYWYLSTNSSHVYVNNKQSNNRVLLFGDYIFFHGLKIIVCGRIFLINNPKGSVTINNTAFDQMPEEQIPQNSNNLLISSDTPLYEKEDYFLKSSRFRSVIKEEKVIIDEPPTAIKPNDIPIILTIGSQLTMICTSAITLISYINSYLEGNSTTERFIISVVTISITVIGAILWPSLTRSYNNKKVKTQEEKRQQKYQNYLQEKSKKIQLIKNNQKQILLENNISLENCKITIDNKSRNLWERNIENPDFLQVCLGKGIVESKIIIEEPSESFSLEDKDLLLSTLENILKDAKYIEDAPLVLSLTENFTTAIIGNEDLSYKFLDSLFLQIMTFHSYSELKIVVLTNEKNQDHWEYLKVLPHTWNNQKTIRYFATNSEEMTIISNELEKVFENRLENSSEETLEENGEKETSDTPIYKRYRPYYLIFTDDIVTVRNLPIIKRILNYKKNIGFTLLMYNSRLNVIPNETTSFINISTPMSGLISNELIVDNQHQFTAQFNESIDLYSCASKLANIPIQLEKAKYELPNSISFLELYNVGKVEQLNSLERWKNNNPVNSLSVPVGIDQNGELFKMDIHEKAYGPHGLVAGTTGSGKSEWIVTLILSLAVNYNPDEIQFVIIDYKGGGLAMSFENSELGIKLPHLAGTITNLNKSEINRAISSIESELKRRQRIFNEAREKLKESSMNIYKYQQLYRKGLVDEPLSHLLIICDEFAELKSQQIEFMDQLISTSRIGRSLGVHLILATQKPSGVVNDQIWSNSRFKICFRVQDTSDSQEILKKPDAAYLKQVGAFYLSIGNDEYYNLGQSAWAGAKYYPSEILKTKIDESVQYIDNIGRVINYYNEESLKKEIRESEGEELLNVIKYIDKISKEEPFKKRQLWLPNIPKTIYLHNLIQKYNHERIPFNFNIVIGEYDEPRNQEQSILKINLAEGNIAIFGSTGSGKEKLINTIIWSSITEHTPEEINYYILDFGAETLKIFAKSPQVGEVVFQDELDKVAGVIDLINEEIEKRKELFADYNGSYDFYIKNSGQHLPLIVLVINAFDIFSELLPQLSELITSLFRDSTRYGVIFVTSVSSATGIRARQLQYFNHIIVLQMNDESAYRNLTNCRRGLIPNKNIGRGICKTKDTNDSYCEFQTAFIAEDSVLISYMKDVIDKLASFYQTKAKQLAKIPETVTSNDLIKYITDLKNTPIGFNFYEKDIAKFNFITDKMYLITSKDLKNNMKFIYALANMLSNIPNTKVRVIDLLGYFEKPILDIKLFNEDLDVVFAALENDVKTRNETQDYGINIILGAGMFKKKLSKAGIEIAESMFNSIATSKKCIYLLIDNYDKIRNLKLETWYNYIDTTKGIWLGPGIQNQSIFVTEEIKPEDLKYDFEGVAYTLENSKYQLIKTMMDGDE